MKNKVEINIGNQQYTIISEEPAEEIEALAAQINGKLSEIMGNARLSLTQALVLTALDLANDVKKQEAVAEKFKSEIADYLDDAAKAMEERDRYKRELDKLKAKQ